MSLFVQSNSNMGPGHLSEGICLLLGTIDAILRSTGTHSSCLCLSPIERRSCSPEVMDAMGKAAENKALRTTGPGGAITYILQLHGQIDLGIQ